MTWLDQAIGWLSPGAGERRIAARRRIDMHGRAYDAAKRDHRTASWQAGGTDANAEVGASEEIVRNRCRDLLRNNGWALQIVDTFADHVVGTGIVGAPTGLKGRNAKKVAANWRGWSEACDHDGDHDLNGLLWLSTKGMAESGAAIIRFRRLQFDASVTVAPLQLQVMEPDFLDPLKSGSLNGGGYIDRGIEYDGKGRKVAYWLLPAHPGDVAQFRSRSMQSERVPANEIVYLYNKLRPGQDRGMPLLAPAVMTLRDLRGYLDAELVRKRIASCMAGFITEKEGDNGVALTDPKTGQALAKKFGRLVEKFEPGMMTRLFPGEDITMATPPNAPGIAETAQYYLREAAAAAGVMYEHATGDFSGVNYSSWRAGHHGFRRRMERIQWLVVVHKLCRVIAQRYREAALAAQLLPAANFGWRWTPPGFISVDPYKDAQADLANLRMGKVTLSQLVEERGYDYLEFLAQYAEDIAAAETALGAGVMFDGDPRKVMNPAKGDNTGGGKKADEASNDSTDAADAA
ncbi:phage portal protein [Sphingomonas solaris]|uniref:Phage portal protein n=1 Tax=Alterirhizorhabdus solaris TaxID=2529389 RepID=A0A558R827_9SPHN|nr:phage portal protein [Sphingomonas solaris]TVV75553.1 phage portal protein [Sphingomonas solaris]